MAILRVFGDEAGTMPMDDNDSNFVTATIAVLGEPPVINTPNGHVDWLVEKLKELDAVPHVTFIDPKLGYGQAIKGKLSKMNLMARLTKFITGANRQYLTEQGIPLRNHVWQFCMGQAIAQAVVSAIAKDTVDSVAIVLDQKAMAKPHRKLFENNIRRIGDHLGGILEMAKKKNPNEAELIKSRLLFSRDTISIKYSDDPLSMDFQGGVWLSHYLARHYHRGLSRGNKLVIKERLAGAGYIDIEKDLTEIIIAPINREAIERWEQNTGLREPKEDRYRLNCV